MSPRLQYPEKTTRLNGIAKIRVVDNTGFPAGPMITLPMPVGLSFGDGVAYENAEMGMGGNLIGDPNAGKILKSAAENITVEEAQRIGKDMLAKAGGNKTRAGMGRTPNPNTRALFKQVNLRTFQLTYKMIPSSASEAESIDAIVEEFRKELYPQSTSSDGIELAYLFPKQFRIRFYLGSNTDEPKYEVKPKLLDAYLTNMTTQYNAAGGAVLAEKGKKLNFSETDISLTFLESRTLFSRDVRKGF
jgi:hypothetical protein